MKPIIIKTIINIDKIKIWSEAKRRDATRRNGKRNTCGTYFLWKGVSLTRNDFIKSKSRVVYYVESLDEKHWIEAKDS